MPATLSIEIHRVGTAITGQWCDRCRLPSVVAVPMALADGRTLRTVSRFDATICTDCGTRENRAPT